jgi:hypothetical protein
MTQPHHAFFGVSKFTYLGRNGTFLDLIGLYKNPLRNVVLLGSGPIEPFEVSALPRFRDAIVTAIDSDPEVYQLICSAVDSGRLDMGNLAKVCRSADAENSYLQDVDRMFRQLAQVRHQGWQASWESRQSPGAILINQQLKGRLKAMLSDLQKELPREISRADLIFEGFMLVNWAKTSGADSLSEQFLRRLSENMSPNAWFASATSVTHYCGYADSRPFLRQALTAGLLPAAGVMIRWAVDDTGRITSQFGSVFCTSKSVQQSLLNLGATFEHDTIHWISTLDLQCRSQTVDLSSLAALLEKGDVICYRAIGHQMFQVLIASWAELSRRCQFNGRPYELNLDYEEQSV